MKKIFLAVCLTMATVSTFAAGGFYIEYKMALVDGKEGVSGVVKVYNGGTASRSELNMNVPGIPGGGMNMVSIHKESEPAKIYMINDASKTYSVMDVSKFKNAVPNSAKTEHEYEVTIVGSETVNGYKSTHVKIKIDGRDAQELWTSKEIASFEKYAQLSSSKYAIDNSLWAALKAKGAEGFPIRMQMQERGGKMQMDLIKAEKRDIAASLVSVPADYKQINVVDGIMKQMGMPTKDDMLRMTPEQREQMMREMEQKYKSQQ